jgi:hypothetical protein
MGVIDDNRSAVLNKDPHDWSEADVAYLCQRFSAYCDSEETTLDQLLVKRLWRYWFLLHGDQPLMDDPCHNIALMLNAAVLGEFVPPAGYTDFFARYRQAHAELEQSLSPPQLSWGPRATMNTVSGPTLDSAVVHVSVSRSDGVIHEILVTGEGLPELRQEILPGMLSCMLRVQAGDLDMLNVDAYRIVAPTGKQDLLELPGIATLGSGLTRPPNDEQTAAAALSESVRKLLLLQNQTEMVVVHECDATKKQDFDASLRNYAKEAHENQQVTVIAKEDPGLDDVITFAPYYSIAQRPSPLRLMLDPAVIQLSSFEQLLEAFTYCTVERIAAAGRVRQETYEERVVQLRMRQERWRAASERTRKEAWPEFLWLSERFNRETGTITQIKPIKVTTSEYMEEFVPSLIEQFEDWAKQMRRIVSDITEATSRSDTPIRRLAASRFLDAALRDRGHLIDDLSTRRCFDRWSAQVAPLIRFNWNKLLRARGIDPQSVFTRNTVFHTRFQVDEMHNLIGLVMQPLAMISPTTCLLTFDHRQPAVIIRSPHDYALAGNEAAHLDANQLWQDLKHLTAENEADPEEFSTRVRSVLSKAPFELLPKLIREIESMEEHSKDSHLDLENLELKRTELVKKVRIAEFPSKMTTMLNHRAFHSARKLIAEIRIEDKFKVRLLLWQALVECLAQGEDPNEYMPEFIGDQRKYSWRRTNDGSEEIAQLLAEAQLRDSSFVQEWLERFRNSETSQPAVDLLQRDWPRLGDLISTPQDQTLADFFTAIESVALAKQLEKAATGISAAGESTATLLSKVGQPLEDLLLTDFAAIPFSDIVYLIETLGGTEITSN